jgi:hypothetical protein
MALRVAVASGNWSNPAIWNGGVLPSAGDIVASNTFNVTIDQNINVDSLTNAAQSLVDSIPNMTSPTSPSGIVTASSEQGGNPAWRAFDGSTSTSPAWYSASSMPQWIAYEFASPIPIDRYQLILRGDGYDPKDWTFEAWNGSTWIVLDTVVNRTSGGTYLSPLLNNTTAYIKYRVNVTNHRGNGYVIILEIDMFPYLGTLPAIAGGGFILNDGVTVTCTGTNGIINGNTTCITFSALGTYYINSRIVNNGSANCINITAAVTLYIVGEITNFSGNGFATINAAAACVVYITGNVRGSGTPGGRCIVTSNGAEVRITGNVTTLGAGNANKAIIINNFSRVYIIGNVFYETTHASNSDIINNSGYLNVVGTLNAFSTNGGFYVIQSTSAAAINIFTGPFISSPEGSQPLYVSRMHYQRTLGSYYEFRDNSTNGALPPNAPAPATRLVSPNTTIDSPIPANVRQGVNYALGTLTGTMKVPNPENVSKNVPIDNTIGTAVLSSADVWAIPTSELNEEGSIGQRLKNISTVESVGDQIVGLLSN